MSHHIQGHSRTQTTLLPEVLNDFVTEDNPVCVIDFFVNEINLSSLGFHRVQAKQTGRPGYNPATLLIPLRLPEPYSIITPLRKRDAS
jgi:hypothetical protein